MFDEIKAQTYRGHLIKRYDIIVNDTADQSIKCHATGTINREWVNTTSSPEFAAYFTNHK